MDWIERALEQDSITRRQGAIALLGTLDHPEAARSVGVAGRDGRAAADGLHLDVHDAIAKRSEDSMKLLAALHADGHYSTALMGGDADRGRSLVRYHAAAAHRLPHDRRSWGHIGPDLTDAHERLDRAAAAAVDRRAHSRRRRRHGDVTAMPEMIQHLTPRQVRDIVEYRPTSWWRSGMSTRSSIVFGITASILTIGAVSAAPVIRRDVIVLGD